MPRRSPVPLPPTGLALVALGALLWGLSGGLGGVLMARGWDPLVLSLHRGAFGLACVLAWLLLSRPWPARPNMALVAWAVLAGLGVAGNFGFYFLSIRTAGVAVAATLMYCAPVFVFAISVLLRLERATPVKTVAVGGVVAGLALLTQIHATGAVSLWGIASGLLAGLSYALFLFGFRAALRHGTAPMVMAVALTTVVLALLPFVDGTALFGSLVSADLPWFVLLGVIGAGLSFNAYIVGLRRTVPTVAAVVAMVEPVTASLIGVLVLGETLSPLQLTGMAVILAAVVAVSARADG